MFKKYKIILILLTVFIIPQWTNSFTNISHSYSDVDEQKEKINEVFDKILENHVGKSTPEEIANHAIEGMLSNLGDPYNKYFSKEEMQNFMDDLEGSFVGIGVYLEEKDKKLIVQSPMPHSPAERAGILAGDEIIAIDGKNVEGQAIEMVVSMVKGKEGTSVQIQVRRGTEKEAKELQFEITREKITVPLVESKVYVYDNKKVGYISLADFSEESFKQFKEHLQDLQSQSIEGLILDLRNNPGGLLNIALNISELFIDEGTILHVKGKNGEEESLTVYGGNKWNLPMITLINESSASASEVLTGALKDYEITKVVGTKSFGKGLVQRIIELKSEGLVKLTVQEYFTPKHKKINGIGIVPDYLVENPIFQEAVAKKLLGVYDEVKIENESLWIGDKKYEGETPLLVEKEYVSLHLLDALYGDHLTFDPAHSLFTWKVGNSEKNLSLEKGKTLLKDKELFINVHYLPQIYPQQFTFKDHILTLKK